MRDQVAVHRALDPAGRRDLWVAGDVVVAYDGLIRSSSGTRPGASGAGPREGRPLRGPPHCCEVELGLDLDLDLLADQAARRSRPRRSRSCPSPRDRSRVVRRRSAFERRPAGGTRPPPTNSASSTTSRVMSLIVRSPTSWNVFPPVGRTSVLRKVIVGYSLDLEEVVAAEVVVAHGGVASRCSPRLHLDLDVRVLGALGDHDRAVELREPAADLRRACAGPRTPSWCGPCRTSTCPPGGSSIRRRICLRHFGPATRLILLLSRASRWEPARGR